MRDNLDPNEPLTPRTRETPIEQRPVADREVPLTSRTITTTLHAWLDGGLAENAVQYGIMAKDADFWVRLDRELLVRRQMKTPAHVFEQIMEALPDTAPAAETKWHQKSFSVTPMLAIGVAAGALAAGIVIGAVLIAR
jgi:hypothetical protein